MDGWCVWLHRLCPSRMPFLIAQITHWIQAERPINHGVSVCGEQCVFVPSFFFFHSRQKKGQIEAGLEKCLRGWQGVVHRLCVLFFFLASRGWQRKKKSTEWRPYDELVIMRCVWAARLAVKCVWPVHKFFSSRPGGMAAAIVYDNDTVCRGGEGLIVNINKIVPKCQMDYKKTQQWQKGAFRCVNGPLYSHRRAGYYTFFLLFNKSPTYRCVHFFFLLFNKSPIACENALPNFTFPRTSTARGTESHGPVHIVANPQWSSD